MGTAAARTGSGRSRARPGCSAAAIGRCRGPLSRSLSFGAPDAAAVRPSLPGDPLSSCTLPATACPRCAASRPQAVSSATACSSLLPSSKALDLSSPPAVCSSASDHQSLWALHGTYRPSSWGLPSACWLFPWYRFLSLPLHYVFLSLSALKVYNPLVLQST